MHRRRRRETQLLPQFKYIRALKLGEDLFFRHYPKPKIIRALKLGEDLF